MKKWAIWKTICVVVASILFVSGISVLGVYLAGGFKEKRVAPNTISFAAENEMLFNPDTNQYEVTDSFNMIVNGQSESGETLTEKRVELSLDGGEHYKQSITDEDGNTYDVPRVRNSVLIIPQFCTIGQPFEVRVQKSVLQENGENVFDANGSPIYWINGGISTITASINNRMAQARVAVDTPVYRIEATAVDLDGNEKSADITLNDRFSLKAKFFPENSAYLFNDQNNTQITSPRKRLEFFEPATDKIDTLFDEALAQRYFVANEISENNQIQVYTFVNAQKQIDVYNQLFAENDENIEDTYGALTSTLKTSSFAASTTFKFNIVKAAVKSFEISPGGRWESRIGENFEITMKQSVYADAFLGANITSEEGIELVSMMQNIALTFEYLDGENWVPAGDKIVIENGHKVEGFADELGREYYFADTTPPNPNFAHWIISANVAQDSRFKITAVLLIEHDNTWKAFDGEKDEDGNYFYSFDFDAKLNIDQPVSWADNRAIERVLEYDGVKITPWTYGLENRASVPEENQYRTVRFFVAFRNTPEDQIKRILGNAGDEEQNPYIGNYMVGTQTLKLYPLDSNELNIYDVGQFELYFATIRTKESGENEIDEEGRYVIVQMVEQPISVRITKSLYPGSITGLESKTTAPQNEDENYYFFNGTTDTITLTFGVEEDSWAVALEKIADEMFTLRLFDANGNEITDYFSGTSTPTTDAEGHTFTYTLSVKGAFVDMIDHILSRITLKDEGNSNLSEWEYTFGNPNWTFDGEQGPYVLYTPHIDRVELKQDSSLDDVKIEQLDTNTNLIRVVVNQSLKDSGGLETEITYLNTNGGYTQSPGNIEQFLSRFTKTVTDQHGNTAVLGSMWRYGTNANQAITIMSGGQSISFPTTQGTQTARLWIVGSANSAIKSTLEIEFQITATGIDAIKYDSTPDHSVPPELTEGDLSQTVKIAKYGASATGGNDDFRGGTITFANLVELYIEQGQTKFSNFNFKFSTEYLYSLADEDVSALFGENGMLSFSGFKSGNEAWTLDVTNAATIRQSLSELCVQSMTFEHNFMIDGVVLKFEIVDSDDDGQSQGIISIPMDFTILSNFTATGSGETLSFYAAKDTELGSNLAIKYQNDKNGTASKTLNIRNLLKNGQAIVLADEANSTYKFADVADDYQGEKVGVVIDGGLKFDEVWSDTPMSYSIILYPDIENKYAPSYIIKVEVKKNFKFELKQNAKYTFVGGTDDNVGTYITWAREVEGSDPLPAITLSIDTNPYIDIKPVENGFMFRTYKDDQQNLFAPVFDWNQLFLTYTIAAEISDTTIGEISMNFYPGVTAEDVARRLTTSEGDIDAENDIFATTETINDVTYLKVTEQLWYLHNSNQSYYFAPPLKCEDKSNKKSYTPLERLYNPSALTNNIDYSLRFSALDGGISGIGNDKSFLIVNVRTNALEDRVYVLVPLIVSQVGLVNGIYGKADGTTTLASLQDLCSTNADQLINAGKYLELTAGQSNLVVARPYSELFTEIGEKEPGIYWLSPAPNANTIRLSVLSTLKVENVDGRLKTSPATDDSLVTVIPDANVDGSRSINIKHLVGDSRNPEDVQYVVLQVVITSAGKDLATFYYILKINPDATIGGTVYPYADNAEYIKTGENEPLTVELDEQFGKMVRDESIGKYRFNMLVNGERVDNGDFNVVHTYAATNSQGIAVSENELKVEFDDAQCRMIVTPTTNGTYTIVVTRTYTDFVGAKLEYTFILNDQGSSYTLKFEKVGDGDTPTQDLQDPTLYNLTLNKTSANDEDFDLIVKFVDTTSGVESPIPGEIEMHGEEPHLMPGKPTQDADLYGTFEYNNKETKAGELEPNTLRIYFVEYLDQDKETNLYIYSKYGFLARVHLTFAGNVAIETNLLTIQAGRTQKISSLLTSVKLYGGQEYQYFDSPFIPSYTQATPEEEAAHSDNRLFYYGLSNVEVLQVKSLADGENLSDLVYFNLSSSDFGVNIRPSIQVATAKLQISIQLYQILEWQEDDIQEHRIVGQPYSYTFNLDLTINPNIKNNDNSPVSSNDDGIKTIVKAENVIAQDSMSDITLNDLFSITGSVMNTTVQYKWEALSGGNAFVSSSGYQNVISIQTNYVASLTSASAKITVGLFKPGSSTPYQEFSVIYQFIIEPDVTIVQNYPKPTKGEALNCEYIQESSTLTASDIINGTAPFADAKRFVVTDKKNGNQAVTTTTGMTLQIVSLQNADVYSGSTHYTQDGTGSQINNIDETTLTFKKGTWNATERKNQDNGEKSIVTFRLTYHEVFAEYTFEIVDRLYDISFNQVYTDTTGGTEIFYVDDLTGSRNIFEKGRILSFTVAQTADGLSTNSTLYVVLEKNTGTQYSYTCEEISLSAADIGRDFKIDLGDSYSRIVGVYNAKPSLQTAAQDEQWQPGTADKDITEDMFGDTLKLTSRVKLVYNNIEVDYDKFSSDLKISGQSIKDFVISDQTLKNIDQNNMLALNYKDGSATASYTYKLDVDFAVAHRVEFIMKDGQLALNSHPETTINVSQTIKLVDSFEVYKPSVGTTRLITKKDIDGDHKIELEVIGLNSQVLFGNFGGLLFWDSNREDLDKLNAIYNYPGTINNPYPYTDIFTPYKDNIENAYLTISPNQDEELNAYDYDIHAYGAKNLGNYVAFRLTYTVDIQDVGKITKDFYMIVKVVPDYTITYQRASGVEMDELGIYSNDGDNEIFQLNLAEGKTDQYESVTVAGGSNPIVQAMHKGSTTAPGDRAAQNFTYTLTYGDSGIYNNENNVNAKLAYTGGPFEKGSDKHWKEYKDGVLKGLQWTPYGANSQISLDGAKVVKFGAQKYRLKAEDDYGYIFYVCFQLNGTGETPTLASAELTEDNIFDVGVEYNVLDIEPQDGVEGKATVVGWEDDKQQPQGQGVDALVLQDLSAWGFKNDISGGSYSQYFGSEGNTWKEKAKGHFNDADLQFFEVLDFTKLRVLGIDFYTKDGNKETISPLIKAGDGTTGSIIKTQDGLKMIGEKNGIIPGENLAETFKVPRFDSTVYGQGTEAQLDIVIRFGYNWNGSDKFEEYYDLRSTVTVRRNISISSQKMVVRDGVEFDVKTNINVSKTKQETSGTTNTPVTDFDVYDDTIEIIVPANQTVRYTVQAATDFASQTEKPLEETTFAKNESNSAIKVYESLSNILHTTLSKEHKFKILENVGESQANKWPEGTKFIYRGAANPIAQATEGNDSSGAAPIPITPLPNGKDTIMLEDAQYLSGDNRIDDLKQYYLISVPTGGASSGESVEYRYTQFYNVTGHYYSLAYNYHTDRKFVDNYLTVENETGTQYVIPVEAWANELKLQILTSNGDGTEKVEDFYDITADLVYSDTNQNGYLKFEYQVVNNAGGGTGQVTMDEKTGTITTLPGFNINSHHIKVTIKQRVSDMTNAPDAEKFITLNDVDAPNREFIFSLLPQADDKRVEITSLVNEKKIDFVGNYLSEGTTGSKKSSVSLPADLEIKDTTHIFARVNASHLLEGTPASFDNDKLTVTLKIDGADKNFLFDGNSSDVEEKYYLFSAGKDLYKRGEQGQIEADRTNDAPNKTTVDYKIEKNKLETYNAAINNNLIVCQDNKIYIKIEELTVNENETTTEYFIDSGISVTGENYQTAYTPAGFELEIVLARDINELKMKAESIGEYDFKVEETYSVAGYTVLGHLVQQGEEKVNDGYYFLAKEIDGGTNYQLYTILSNFAFSVTAGE